MPAGSVGIGHLFVLVEVHPALQVARCEVEVEPARDGRAAVRLGSARVSLGFCLMSIYAHRIATLDGRPFDLEGLRGKAVLVVNVASKCGLTPQYTGLQELQHKYADRGFTVLGVPCNQFGGQEPGTAEEISTFCLSTYGVTFPMTEKVDVNGKHKHPLFAELGAKADASGEAGDIQWNFEKFLLSPSGEVVARFRPTVTPEAEELVSALEAVLPS